MAYEEWGPLGKLVGVWESGFTGLDVSYHNEKGKVAETPFREKTIMKPFGPVDNGEQSLYGLDYRMSGYREGEDNPFHTEVGYWLWDAKENQVLKCFIIPRGSNILAGGTASADATSFTLTSELGSNTYGITSNLYLDRIAKCTKFDVTITVDGDTFSYEETSVIEHAKSDVVILHTDRNTLTRTSWEA
jgi:hypothetical protein